MIGLVWCFQDVLMRSGRQAFFFAGQGLLGRWSRLALEGGQQPFIGSPACRGQIGGLGAEGFHLIGREFAAVLLDLLLPGTGRQIG